MDASHSPDAEFDADFLRSMVLLTTLTATSRVWQKIAERRVGVDPSSQEAPEVVRPYLKRAGEEVTTLLMRLQHSLVYARHNHEARLPGLVRRFDNLLALSRLADRLQMVHQRLLSLYPGVTEALAEEARALQSQAVALQEVEATEFLHHLAPFIKRALDFATWMQEELDA